MNPGADTGLGLVSATGNTQEDVVDSLKVGRSGIVFSEEYKEMGFRSHIHGPINIDLDEFIDRKVKRFMGDGAAFNYIAMQQAIADAGLDVPEGCEVTVLEDRAELMHLVLPSPRMAYDDIDEGNVGEDIVTVGKAAFASGLFPRADPGR